MNSRTSYSKNNSGNVATMFALALVPLVCAAGVAVDMVHANQVKTVLQGAVDAAALAAATGNAKLTDGQLQEIVAQYLEANGSSESLDLVSSVSSQLNNTSRTFTVRLQGKLDSTFMQVAGISSTDFDLSSEIKLGGAGLEVALVLDNTASMNSDGRLPALKVAASELVDNLMKIKSQGAYVKIGIVPFSDYVNVGVGSAGESWVDVPPTVTKTENICSVSYPNATSSNCHTENGMWNNDGVPTPYTYQVCDWVYGDPVTNCSDQTWTSTWAGCVGSRTSPLDAQIGQLSTRYPGLQNVTCPSPVVPLSSDATALKQSINDMVAVGNTYIPSGILWGWNVLDDSKPLTGAKTASEIASMGGTKALVLMTDGENTLSADYPWHWGNNANVANAKTAELCANAKADGIVIYTVSFMVTNSDAKNLLQACATDSSKAFSADDASQLSKAFDDIGQSLLALRISR